MGANDKQVSGTHYQTNVQPWDFIVANNLGYLEGNIVKYISRYKRKNGIEDLNKAKHYLEKLIEVTENDSMGTKGSTPYKEQERRAYSRSDTDSEGYKGKGEFNSCCSSSHRRDKGVEKHWVQRSGTN